MQSNNLPIKISYVNGVCIKHIYISYPTSSQYFNGIPSHSANTKHSHFRGFKFVNGILSKKHLGSAKLIFHIVLSVFIPYGILKK